MAGQVRFTDSDISALLGVRKPLPTDYRPRMALKPKRGHKERELDVRGEDGSDFIIILRQSDFNALDFSVILGYRVPGTNQVFRLRRYNGRSHRHTNAIEGQTFYDFHIHQATERYQARGFREDTYADTSNRYSDLNGAIFAMFSNCGFDIAQSPQGALFED